MKQKRLVYYFLVIAVALTLSLPVLNMCIMYKERKINVQNISKQQLFSTDYLESIKNYIIYKVLNISLNEAQVIAGKDHFFFLGNSFAGIIDKVQGTFSYSKQDIDIWTTKLKKLQDWYEKQGIQFIIVVASNKHTIYNDKLPNYIHYKEGETITDDIVKYSLDKNVHILNLKNILRKEKQDKQLFFHADTHWNHYGALIGYSATMKYLNTVYKKNYKMARYSIVETATNSGGDLTNFLKINHFLAQNDEKDYKLIFAKKNEKCYGKITESNILQKCTPGIKNTFNQYVINAHAPNKEKLLYVCDSFGLGNSKLYEETFNTMWRLHIQYIAHMNTDTLASFIKKNRPKVVIYQIVERDITTNFVKVP